jgi:hypothetical protein
MGVDIATLGLEVRSDGVVVAIDRLKNLTAEGGRAERVTSGLGSSFGSLAGYIKGAVAAMGLWKLADYIKDSILLAARYETLGAAMVVVGNNAGYTARQMSGYQQELQKTGIAMVEARETLTKMASAQMDLAKSAQLARIAQDAAVIGGINSSQAFSRMIDGIQRGETEILKTIGINVKFEDSYKKLADQTGKTSKELSETEKIAARTNAVIEQGINIAGAYEAAMGTAGKQLLSMQRYMDNLKVVLGSTFNDALIVAVSGFTDGLKDANTEAERLQREGKLKEWGREIVQVFAFVADAVRGVLTLIATVTGATISWHMQVSKLLDATAKVHRLDFKGARESLRDFRSYSDAYSEDMKKRWGNTIDNSFQLQAERMFAARAANAPAEQAKAAALEQQRIAAAAARRIGASGASKSPAGGGGAGEAEQWRKTYADLRKEVDALTPGLDEYAKKIADIDNKYTDLMHKKGADIVLLQQLRAEHLRAIEAQKQFEETLKQAKIEADEYKDRLEAMAAAKKAYWQGIADTIKTVEAMQPGSGFDAMNSQIGKFQEIAEKFPDMADKVSVAIAKLKADFAESSGLNAMLSRSANREIDMIDDPYRRQIAELTRRYEEERKQIKLTTKAHKDSAEARKAEAIALATLDAAQAQKAKQITDDETSARLSTYADYASLVGGLFTALADTQDQSSRKGFEAAKALNIGAAIMSTAAGIMKALAQVPYPMDIVQAAAIGAMGAIQIAKIASTTFGGGAGSVGGVTAGFTGGGGNAIGGGTVGTSIGAQYVSASDSQTEESLQALAASAENASLALNKVSDGLTDIADLLNTSQAKLLTGSLTQGEFSAPPSGLARSWSDFRKDLKDIFSGNLLTGITGPITSVLNTFFGIGNKWYTKYQGIALGGRGDEVRAMGYLYRQKDGGWFTDDKTGIEAYKLNSGLTDSLNAYMQQIRATIVRAATIMGTEANIEGAKLPAGNIITSGQTPENIQKSLETWFAKAADAMGQTVTGLKDFTYYGESAFDALVRLATALQGVNEGLELIGVTLVSSTLEGANSAYKLQELMGGSEKFADAVDTYFSNMFTDDEQRAMKAAQATRQVNVAFAEMGRVVPATRSDFISLVNSLDVTTEAGASTFAALMSVSEAFALMTESAATAAEQMRAAFLDVSMSAAETLKSILGGPLSTLTPSQLLFQQRAAWQGAVSTGNTAALPGLAESYLTSAREMFGSGTGYTKIYETVTRTLADVAGISGDITLDNVQRQIDAITRVQDAISAGTTAMVNSIAELKAEIAAMRKDADANAQKIVTATDNNADIVAGTFSAVARA